MRIIFEDHQYDTPLVQDVLKDISTLEDVEKKVSVKYVGYFYNSALHDCVFILPKVLLTDVKVEADDGKKKTREVIAGIPQYEGRDVTPEDIINPDGQEKYLSQEYRKFIFEFAVWIYRSLCVYREKHPDSKAIYYKQVPQKGNGKRHRANTYLDIILSLIKFNQENQDFFMFIVKNMHSGFNKINWTRTISKSQAFFQNGTPIYLNPVNKKRDVNFDEELLVIFFSILNYINKEYGFRTPINLMYDLIKDRRFEQYKNGYGRTRLKQIKYKYFSDKALILWDLCYAFFDSAHKLAINTDQREYLLTNSFEVVFEAMIDNLIGDSDVPKRLKNQADGKRVDHMYSYDALTRNDVDESDEQIYYIGDSKYYKSGNRLGRESVYKQYTYARNVIQWNIDLFMNEDLATRDMSDEEKDDYKSDKQRFEKIRLRKDTEKGEQTEGYNVIPNFFLSAYVSPDRKYVAAKNIVGHRHKAAKGEKADKDGYAINDRGEYTPKTYFSCQFENRLFDRDTMVLSHYDVNFLYVIYLYARQRSSEKAAWKKKVREMFRDEIREVLEKKFDFYAMMSKTSNSDTQNFIKDHFKDLNGKIYRPFADSNVYTLALEKVDDKKGTKQSDTFKLLQQYFEIEPVDKLGSYPQKKLKDNVEDFHRDNGGPLVYIGADRPDTYIAQRNAAFSIDYVKSKSRIAVGIGDMAFAAELLAQLLSVKHIYIPMDEAKSYLVSVKNPIMAHASTVDRSIRVGLDGINFYFLVFELEGDVKECSTSSAVDNIINDKRGFCNLVELGEVVDRI